MGKKRKTKEGRKWSGYKRRRRTESVSVEGAVGVGGRRRGIAISVKGSCSFID